MFRLVHDKYDVFILQGATKYVPFFVWKLGLECILCATGTRTGQLDIGSSSIELNRSRGGLDRSADAEAKDLCGRYEG